MAEKSTARVFMSGSSQGVRLPMEFRFDCDQVVVRRQGNSLVLTPLPKRWEGLVEEGEALPDELVAAVLDDSDLQPLEKRAEIE